VRAEHDAGMTRPAWDAVADVTAIGPGTRVLAGLMPGAAGDVAVPHAPPDGETPLRGLLPAGDIGAVGEHAVRRVLLDGSAPFRPADGSYLFRTTSGGSLGRLVPTVPDVRFRSWAAHRLRV